MKTAVSIPDEVFKGAERLDRPINKSRRKLYTDAVKEYVAPHAQDDTTDCDGSDLRRSRRFERRLRILGCAANPGAKRVVIGSGGLICLVLLDLDRVSEGPKAENWLPVPMFSAR